MNNENRIILYYGSCQLTRAGRSANHRQIGQHCTWLASNSDFLYQRIFIFCFTEPLGINVECLKVFCLGSNFLLKSILTGCEPSTSRYLRSATFYVLNSFAFEVQQDEFLFLLLK